MGRGVVAHEKLGLLAEAALTVPGRGRGEGGRLDPATQRKYARAWVDAELWVRSVQSKPMPWSSETLAQYARTLLEQGYAKSTVDGRLAAVKAKHRERGSTVPDGVAAWYVLRGADHIPSAELMVNTPHPRRGALAAISAKLDVTRAQAARDLCLITLGWDVHGRVSELVALDMDSVVESDDRLLVTIGGRRLWVEHLHEPVDVCPVEAWQAWMSHLRAAGALPGPLFRAVDRGDNIAGCGIHAGPPAADHRLSDSGVRRIWHKLVVKGRLPRASSASDLRVASALDAARNGVPVGEIMARGGWSLQGRVLAKLIRAAEEGAR